MPGCGKSTFGRWLKSGQGFEHIDMETQDLERFGLQNAWDEFWQGRDSDKFLRSLSRLSPKIVLDWGFPPSLLGVVSNLKSNGANLWWFDGDRLSARVLCAKAKGAAALPAFDCQCARIAAEWASIGAVFGSHIIRTVAPGGAVMSPESVWSIIGGSS